MTKDMYAERQSRLLSLTKREPSENLNMCLSFSLSEILHEELKINTKMFFRECLREYFRKDYDYSLDIYNFANEYQEDLKLLPNITPNGLVLSKSETSCSYNQILKTTADIIEYLGLANNLQSIHYPVNIRLKWGNPDDYTLNRPYASTKWHSDIWAGESSENIMIHIPIFGDFKSNGISMAKSQDGFYPDYVRHLNNYDEGLEITKDVKSVKMHMETRKAYVLDSFLLHKTDYGNPSFRGILSFPVVPKAKLASDIYHNPRRDENYVDTETWMQFGRKYFVRTDDKLEKYVGGDVSKISYANTYRIVR